MYNSCLLNSSAVVVSVFAISLLQQLAKAAVLELTTEIQQSLSQFWNHWGRCEEREIRTHTK